MCIVIKSATEITSVKLERAIPSSRALSCDINGSYATIRIPSPFAIFDTSYPTRPKPITPRTLPFTSTPMYFFRSHLPDFIEPFAAGILREMLSSIPMVCSAAEIVLADGAFTTSIPRSVAVSTSMLSTPTPARPITFKRVPASIISFVAFVPLRTTNAS